MDKFIFEYTRTVEKGFEQTKAQIVTMKLNFQSTKWTDVHQMIDAANEILKLEETLKGAMELHKLILENYREG